MLSDANLEGGGIKNSQRLMKVTIWSSTIFSSTLDRKQ